MIHQMSIKELPHKKEFLNLFTRMFVAGYKLLQWKCHKEKDEMIGRNRHRGMEESRRTGKCCVL